MPLLRYPHFVAELAIKVTYCDGAHEPDADPMPMHAMADMETYFVIVPPGDVQPDINFPPKTDEQVGQAVDAAMIMVMGVVTHAILKIPGVTEPPDQP